RQPRPLHRHPDLALRDALTGCLRVRPPSAEVGSGMRLLALAAAACMAVLLTAAVASAAAVGSAEPAPWLPDAEDGRISYSQMRDLAKHPERIAKADLNASGSQLTVTLKPRQAGRGADSAKPD